MDTQNCRGCEKRCCIFPTCILGYTCLCQLTWQAVETQLTADVHSLTRSTRPGGHPKMKFHLPTIHVQVRAVSFREVSRLTNIYYSTIYRREIPWELSDICFWFHPPPKMGSRFNDPCLISSQRRHFPTIRDSTPSLQDGTRDLPVGTKKATNQQGSTKRRNGS